MNKRKWFCLILLITAVGFYIYKPVYAVFLDFFISEKPFFIVFQDKFKEIMTYISKFLFIDFIPISANDKSIILSAVYFVIGIVFFSFNTALFEQGAMAIVNEQKSIIKYGILGYGIILCIIVVFLFSIVGAGISIVLVYVVFVLTALGKVSLALLIGFYTMRFKYRYMNILIGYAVVFLLENMPFFGWFVSAVYIPIITIGAVYVSIMNYINKKFYEPMFYENKRNEFDRQKIYDKIISNDIQEEENEK